MARCDRGVLFLDELPEFGQNTLEKTRVVVSSDIMRACLKWKWDLPTLKLSSMQNRRRYQVIAFSALGSSITNYYSPVTHVGSG